MPQPEVIVAAARGWIGTPYQHQASVKGAGSDCLGLLRGVWRELIGPEPTAIPAYAPDWSETAGVEALADAARLWLCPKPPEAEALGDVVLFRMRAGAMAKPLGLISGLGACPSFIHAYSGHGVVETALSAPWRRKIVARFQFPEGH